MTEEEKPVILQPMIESKPSFSLVEVNAMIKQRTGVISKVQQMVELPGGPSWSRHLRPGEVLANVSDEDYLQKAVEVGQRIKRGRDGLLQKTIPFVEGRIRELSQARLPLAEEKLGAVVELVGIGMLRKEDLKRAQGVVEKWRQECGLESVSPTQETEESHPKPKQRFYNEDLAEVMGVDKADKVNYLRFQAKVSGLLKKHHIKPGREKRKLVYTHNQYEELAGLLKGNQTPKQQPTA